MLIPVNPNAYMRRAKKKPRTMTTPAPVGPMLVAATLDESDETILVLTFDQTIAVGAFQGSAITVVDPVSDQTYHATGSPEISFNSATMTMLGTPGSSGTQALLTASASTGIASADGNVPWAGASGFVVDVQH